VEGLRSARWKKPGASPAGKIDRAIAVFEGTAAAAGCASRAWGASVDGQNRHRSVRAPEGLRRAPWRTSAARSTQAVAGPGPCWRVSRTSKRSRWDEHEGEPSSARLRRNKGEALLGDRPTPHAEAIARRPRRGHPEVMARALQALAPADERLMKNRLLALQNGRGRMKSPGPRSDVVAMHLARPARRDAAQRALPRFMPPRRRVGARYNPRAEGRAFAGYRPWSTNGNDASTAPRRRGELPRRRPWPRCTCAAPGSRVVTRADLRLHRSRTPRCRGATSTLIALQRRLRGPSVLTVAGLIEVRLASPFTSRATRAWICPALEGIRIHDPAGTSNQAGAARGRSTSLTHGQRRLNG
jgi:hypothetical protein